MPNVYYRTQQIDDVEVFGGFEVRRALPAPKWQMVGPFIFFDQAGPSELLTGQGIDVRPQGKGRFDLPIDDRDEHIPLPRIDPR